MHIYTHIYIYIYAWPKKGTLVVLYFFVDQLSQLVMYVVDDKKKNI